MDYKKNIKNPADISKAEKMLDYSPDYSFEMGIKEAIEWYKENL